MWFVYDGETFETYNTEAEAKAAADEAMQSWEDAAGDGWPEESVNVLYGQVTHSVRVEKTEITDENRHFVPHGCDGLEQHYLEPIDRDDAELITRQWLIESFGCRPAGANYLARTLPCRDNCAAVVMYITEDFGQDGWLVSLEQRGIVDRDIDHVLLTTRRFKVRSQLRLLLSALGAEP